MIVTKSEYIKAKVDFEEMADNDQWKCAEIVHLYELQEKQGEFYDLCKLSGLVE
jgi:hypothetical protein